MRGAGFAEMAYVLGEQECKGPPKCGLVPHLKQKEAKLLPSPPRGLQNLQSEVQAPLFAGRTAIG